MAVTRADLEGLTLLQATDQWTEVLRRPEPTPGQRQGKYLAIEQVLAFAALFTVTLSSQGGSDWTRYHPDLQTISTSLRRSPASIAEKGRNLTGVRQHGQSHEGDLYAALGSQQINFPDLYVTVLRAARAAGVGPDVLPDFLDLEGASDGWRALFLGSDELAAEDLERAAAVMVEIDGNPNPETVARMVADIRIGQSRFARSVLQAFDHHCGFCGFDGRALPGHRLTVASHIKPWRDASPTERLDPRNGVAACPTHDAAFDTGLLTIEDDRRVRRAGKLTSATAADPVAAAAFAVRPALYLPDGREGPAANYLAWHREHIWVNHATEGT